MFFHRLSSSSNYSSVLEPFKCGVIHPPKTRSIFFHTPNLNDTENKETTNVETVIDATNPPANETSSMFGLHEQDIAIPEELILPETSGDTRIVNGVECPPGDCPWQVETRKHDTWVFGDVKCGSFSVLLMTLDVLSGSSHQWRQHRLLWRHHPEPVLHPVGRSLYESVHLHQGGLGYGIL